MKFSYQWIREYVQGLDIEARDLEQRITVRTAECDGISIAGELLPGAHRARILNSERIAGTDLRKATVDAGREAPITVVCGAFNCQQDLETIWVDIGRKRIHGVESDGMLASPQELGLNCNHDGIIEVQDGWPALEPDQIIEIDNKSLTHRPDLWGHLGMAREVAAITQRPLLDPVDSTLLPQGTGGFDVRVEDFDLCPRFSALVFDNVTVRASPWWLQYRLTSAGLNPINNIVDITNYVMAELAQPMHAFDRDRLRGDRLIVRMAKTGESLIALDDEEYKLGPGIGVLTDAEGPVSIAGVIGGLESAIGDDTTRIVFEAANWKASSIRKTSSALKIRTDASMRFEKSQDAYNTTRALARAVELMREVCPEARLAGGLTDVYRALPEPQTIELDLDVVDRKLGRDVPPGEAADILERLAFGVERTKPRVFTVTIPSWRATKDIAVADDLVEEIGRMVGYDSIPAQTPRVACVAPADDPKRLWLRQIRSFAAARGYTEVYNYSFLSDGQAERFGLLPADLVRVLNPIAAGQNLMRPSLIPGILANLESNAKNYSDFRIFEIGREIHKRKGSLPNEVVHLAAAVYSANGDGESGLFELKRLACSIAPASKIEPARHVQPYEHPARAATVVSEGRELGRLFEFHPRMIEGRGAVLDIDLDALFGSTDKVDRAYKPLRRFPSSAFDLSVVAPAREFAERIEDRLRGLAGPLIENIEYLREYQGPQVPAGSKSVSYRLTLNAPDRTLSSGEVSQVRTTMIEGMRQLGYEMRV